MRARPLKIFLTDPHLRGGGQVRYVTNLACELTRLGHEVVIGCRPGSVLVDSAQQAQCQIRDSFLFRGGLRLRAWRHDVREATQFLRAWRPDIVHVSSSQDHWVCAMANAFNGRPACVVRTRHNTYRVKNSAPNRMLNLRWTDYQIVVCNVVRETLEKQPIFDGTRMCSIHNGVAAGEFSPDPFARQTARKEFGYTDHDLVCGIAARLVSAKGHEFLFESVALLREELPHLRLLLLGQGDKEGELRTLAQELGIEDIVAFAGFRNDMPYCVQAFDIGVQPSIDCDTSSFSLKEQMAAEKPVIASDYGGLKEIVTDGVEGFVVPTGTIEPLAFAIRALARDAALRGRMGQAGRERVLREFTVQVFAERTVEAYHRAIEIFHERSAH